MIPFLPAIEGLEKAGVSYVVVGGLAALAHGVNRYTADVDFVVGLDRENAEKAIRAMTVLGLKPRAPVDPLGFADENQRRFWVKEKHMTVFSFFHPSDPFLVVDFFVEYPTDFEGLYARSVVKQLGPLPVRVCGRDDLIAMKKKAGRGKDMEDVRILEALKNDLVP
jgi:hypothetical protein